MLLQNLRARMSARLSGDREAGFTLIELLVVMLILGILAAIAIPAFFNQRDKATDADAKSAARTAQTAMETYATDNGGVLDASACGAVADVDALVAIEPSLAGAQLEVAVAGPRVYTVTSTSETENWFSITSTDGVATSDCGPTEGEGGCPNGGEWAGKAVTP
jgi:type IV pilus assembly protein PilA